MRTPPTSSVPTAIIGSPPVATLTFPQNGSGLPFDERYPITFPPAVVGDLGAMFPTIFPRVEEMVWQAVNDACNSRTVFPDDGQGLVFPVQFNQAPAIALFAGTDQSYPPINNVKVEPIKVVRGWPAYPGQIPQIGVAESTSNEDPGEELSQAGFAGDVFAEDTYGNVIATAAYYSQPLNVSVVVELIHTNRDERDRLHDQLRAVLFRLKHTIPSASLQIRDVTVNGEKQDLPLDEQPSVIYVSVFSVDVRGEMLVPTEIVYGGVVDQLIFTVDPIPPTLDSIPANVEIDLT